MPTKADNPERENRANKEAADGQTSTVIGPTLATTDTAGEPLHWVSGVNGGERA
ncbi:hypothetical protein SAMN04489841_3977 [Natrinema salaciae]|uniref:Uncharacterized protein n=1 Tax=Natrinema salaciae TaxID=1186196 RepID=A0A1H9PU28_9EURY|nr:hypothetical protein SAMN04489841_3977 [Natrinema salaciae]